MDSNPHVARVTIEHNSCYTGRSVDLIVNKNKRKLPQWLTKFANVPTTSVSVKKGEPDGVFNYDSAVLNDGLLLFELRDAIREGDGPE